MPKLGNKNPASHCIHFSHRWTNFERFVSGKESAILTLSLNETVQLLVHLFDFDTVRALRLLMTITCLLCKLTVSAYRREGGMPCHIGYV